jgi:predicted nucleotidyltransferase
MSNNILTTEEKSVLRELKGALKLILGDRLVKFVLYGSKARGDYDSDSDLDVAIVVRDLTTALKHQILDVVAGIEFKYFVPVSALVLSERDFDRLRERERRIALDIERNGIPI